MLRATTPRVVGTRTPPRVLDRVSRLARARVLLARSRRRMRRVLLARSWRMLRATTRWVGTRTVLRALEPVQLRMVWGTSTRL
ncbi:hypothetical protein [Kribbella sp. VKM Ac-2566]|uniref:hypothetical protein n=1 Tax=Kribbella sp. VKM Ac-2566 TaxID=2512218 RepID=UPI0010E10F4E|nr:hypothetical protein [Kribbella sp. VKM Ac-2566]TDX03487.1 hypothetical protein EV647_1724 [Kribbella sp. VKM Ac-2566]